MRARAAAEALREILEMEKNGAGRSGGLEEKKETDHQDPQLK